MGNTIGTRIHIRNSQEYLEKFNKRYKGGCGVLERATDFLDHENYSKLANMFIKYRYNIIRLEKIDKDAYSIQKDFLNIAKTNPENFLFLNRIYFLCFHSKNI